MYKFMIIMLLFPIFSLAQNRLTTGDEYMKAGYFFEAITKYEANLIETERLEEINSLKFKIAQCHLLLHDYKKAEELYTALKQEGVAFKPEELKSYFIALRSVENYEEARKYVGSAGEYITEEFTIDFPLQNPIEDKRWNLEKTSVEFGNYFLGMSILGEDVLMSKAIDTLGEETGKYELISYQLEGNNPKDFKIKNKLIEANMNSFYVGNPSFLTAEEILFSANSLDNFWYKKRKKDKIGNEELNSLNIYQYNKTTKEVTLSKNLNSADYNSVTPYYDSKNKLLLFSSDKNKKNNFDIYYSFLIASGDWTEPVALALANTNLDEVYPVVQGDYIYFSSKGHENYGGFDILKVKFTLNNQVVTLEGEVTNLGRPINSSYDDFSMYWKDSTSGYFSTNRNKEKGFDELMHFTYSNSFNVKDLYTNEPIAGATVTIFEYQNNKPVKIETLTVNDIGNWDYEFDASKDYSVNLSADRYEEKTIELKLENRTSDLNILKEIGLEPKNTVVNEFTNQAIANIPVLINKLKDGKTISSETVLTNEFGNWEYPFEADENYEVLIKDKDYIEKSIRIKGNEKEKIVVIGLTPYNRIRNSFSDEWMAEIPITIYKLENGEKLQVDNVITDSEGKWSYPFDRDSDYNIEIDTKGYELVELEIGDSDYDRDRIRLINLAPSTEVDNVITVNNIYFKFNSSRLQPESEEILKNVVFFMEQQPLVKFELGAHTDCVGNDSYNMKLSKDRAKSCFDYLVKKGIASNRLKPVGYGETQILNGCVRWDQCSEEENKVNRRIEFKIIN